MSVIENWILQIKMHLPPHSVSVRKYHGAEKHLTDSLDNFDIVLTTYQTLAAEYPKKSSAAAGRLFDLNWRRVILDEGHIIRNRNAHLSKACYALKAQSRWIASGTPIINSIEEFFSALKFLRYRPFDQHVH